MLVLAWKKDHEGLDLNWLALSMDSIPLRSASNRAAEILILRDLLEFLVEHSG
ncbi:hypothetical protein ACVIGB_000953 [Bradyrhizobium sp. USDA 4341]